MATKAGSKEGKRKRSKKIQDADSGATEKTQVYKLWYEFLRESLEVEDAMKSGNIDNKYWKESGITLSSFDLKQYQAWSIKGGIRNTLKTYSADQWKRAIFGTKLKKGDKWKKLFGEKKKLAASKYLPGRDQAKGSVLIEVNLEENSREDIDAAIQQILSGEMKKLSRGRGKKIKKKKAAQFQVNGVADLRALRRCLAIGKFDRENSRYATRRFTRHGAGAMHWRKLEQKFEELQEVQAKHELTQAQFRKKFDYEDADAWQDYGSGQYNREVGEIQKKLDGKLNRMISRDRKRFKKVMASVLEGRFDVS